jgi:hypothetical protein
MTSLKAKINITKSVDDENIPDSKWYLERRDPDFKPKQESTISGSKSLIDAILKKKEECKCE